MNCKRAYVWRQCKYTLRNSCFRFNVYMQRHDGENHALSDDKYLSVNANICKRS